MGKTVTIAVMEGGKVVDMFEVNGGDYTTYDELFDEIKHCIENIKEGMLED